MTGTVGPGGRPGQCDDRLNAEFEGVFGRESVARCVHVSSAGTEPTGDGHPKPLSDEVVSAADVVVTMGCGDACSVMLGHRYLDWDLPDPAGTDLPTLRAVRDPVEDLVAALLTDQAQKENP